MSLESESRSLAVSLVQKLGSKAWFKKLGPKARSLRFGADLCRCEELTILDEPACSPLAGWEKACWEKACWEKAWLGESWVGEDNKKGVTVMPPRLIC
jgi:hypothetical protein